MGLDPLSPIAPACIRALLVPVGQLRHSRFAGFSKRLEENNVVRLGDVSPDNRPHRTLFSPLAFPEGLIVYDLSSTVPPASHLALGPFEFYRQPLLIIGVLDGRQGDVLGDAQAPVDEESLPSIRNPESMRRVLDDLKADFSSAILHQLLIFDLENGQQTLPDGVMSLPSPENSRTTTVKTVMCDLTSLLLGQMTIWGKSVQNAPYIDSPRISNLPSGNERMLSALPPYLTSSSRADVSTGRSRSYSPAADERLNPETSLPAHMPSGQGSRSVTPDSRAPSPSRSRTPPMIADDPSNASKVTSPSKSRGTSQARSRTGSQERESRNHRTESLGDRERMKNKGRIGVVIGGMFLLTGRWPDAVKELVQSANITRSNSDYVWQAKALDYLMVCLLMYAWAGMNFRIPDILRPGAERPGSNVSKNSSHQTSSSLSDFAPLQSEDPAALTATLSSLSELLPDQVNNILNLYSRAWTFTDDKIPPLSYSHSAIRLAKLLVAIKEERGHLNQSVLDHLVLNRPFGNLHNEESHHFISASEISRILLRAYPTAPENAMPLSERTYILAAIASVLSELGYQRKKAVILKELLFALLPALVQARKDGAAEMGVHPAASLASLKFASSPDTFAARSAPNFHDSEEVMGTFLTYVCKSFGLVSLHGVHNRDPSGGTQDFEGGTNNNTENSKMLAIHQASMHHHGSLDIKIDILRACISICEALPNLAGALQYSAELLRAAGSGIAPGPEDSHGLPALPIEEQVRLVNNISRTLGAAQHLGLQHPEADYWDEFLVRGIELLEGSTSKALISHARSELEIVETIAAKKEKNPFIYNPFLKINAASAATDPVLVAGEEATFRITLQNLYEFEIHIERIQIEADNEHFISYPQHVTIGPYRTQTILLKGVPHVSGDLKVTGCLAKIRGCRERSFVNFSEPWEFKTDLKGRNIQSDIVDTKDPRVKSSAPRPTAILEGPKASPLTLKIIEAQPSLRLTASSLSQSAAMLLEGESRIFTMTFRNDSQTTVADLVLLSFNDSTVSQVQSMLASKELSAIELYELELSTSKKQSLRWLQKDDRHHNLRISPREEKTLEIEVYGKPGLSHGSLHVDYGYIGVSTAEIMEKFYTRQLKIPLRLTVSASLDLVRSDISPFMNDSGLFHTGRPGAEYAGPKKLDSSAILASRLSKVSNASSFENPLVLLLLDFRNSWPNTLTLSLTSANETTQHPIAPGSTIRVPLLCPKIYLSPDQAHARIPTLNPATARQFVVSTSTRTSPEAERALREAFWYREELLKQLNATWVEESSRRRGDVEMRSLRLTTRMVSLLRQGAMEITMAVFDTDLSEQAEQKVHQFKQTGMKAFKVTTTSFLVLRTTLRNRSDMPIRPLLRLQPTLAGQPHNVALDLGKKLLVNGILQRGLPLLEPGEKISVDTGFVVLSAGRYEWNACVEEVQRAGPAIMGSQRPRARTGDLDIMNLAGRRVWYGETPCNIIAVEKGEGL